MSYAMSYAMGYGAPLRHAWYWKNGKWMAEFVRPRFQKKQYIFLIKEGFWNCSLALFPIAGAPNQHPVTHAVTHGETHA